MRVLDKGSVELIDCMGNDARVVAAARVSVKSDAVKLIRSDEKLISYLAKNGHTSPFEHVTFTFRVKAPIFVIRQWFRHRTWSYNEESARYGAMSNEFYFPARERWQTQSTDNKQASGSEMDYTSQVACMQITEDATNDAFRQYRHMLKMGAARELARIVLPVNLYSTFYGTVNLHNLAKFIHQRDHEHSQWEIQEYARVLTQLAYNAVPISMEALL